MGHGMHTALSGTTEQKKRNDAELHRFFLVYLFFTNTSKRGNAMET